MGADQMREWIDSATYRELLRKWRFAPGGDPFFQPPMREYYADVMRRRRSELSDAEHVAASKAIGW